MSALSRWRGLKDLVQQAVEVSSRAIERVQKETMARPMRILESLPILAEPVAGIHAIHDLVVSTVHHGIRTANRLVGCTLDKVIDLLDSPPPT